MKTSIRKSYEKSGDGILRVGILLLMFIALFTIDAVAQADISNVKNTLSSVKEEQKELARKEFMNYVYMVIGFAIVIIIAWFSTVKAKKRTETADEGNHHHHYIKHPHDPYKRHHTLHKAKR